MTLWFLSDPHYDHRAMVETFTLADGSPARSFASLEAMQERICEEWASRVRPGDHIYVMGDVCLRDRHLMVKWLKSMPGRKRLLRGNHDVFKTKSYLEAGFEEIHATRMFEGIIFSHYPLHPSALEPRWVKANAHGHTHTVSHPFPYVNMCVEVRGYRPWSLEEIAWEVNKKRMEQVEHADQTDHV